MAKKSLFSQTNWIGPKTTEQAEQAIKALSDKLIFIGRKFRLLGLTEWTEPKTTDPTEPARI